MPLYDFWHGTPELFFAYRQAYIMKRKEDIETHNEKAWLSGVYYLRAMWEVESNINLKQEEKHLAVSYFEQPIDLNATKSKTEESVMIEESKKQEDLVKIAIANSMIALNKRKKQNKNKE